MNIPLYLLETLAVLNEEGSLSKTAARLRTTQPTVSRQLQQLAGHFSEALFESVGRQKRLTPLGQKLALRVSRRLQGMTEEIRDTLIQDGKTDDFILTIGGRREILGRVLGPRSLPCRAELVPMGASEIQQSLERSSLDLAITHQSVTTPNYFRKEIFVDRWALVVPKAFCRGQSDLRNWPQIFRGFPFANYSRDWRFTRIALESLEFREFPREDFVFSDWETIERRVESGQSWAVIPSVFIRPQRSYLTVELGSKFNQTFYLYAKNHFRKKDWFEKLVRSVVKAPSVSSLA